MIGAIAECLIHEHNNKEHKSAISNLQSKIALLPAALVPVGEELCLSLISERMIE